MQSNKRFGQKPFYNQSIKELVSGCRVLRRYDLSESPNFLYKQTKSYCSHTDQPSVDPAVLFKMMLLDYLFGESSERKLAGEIRVNMGVSPVSGLPPGRVNPQSLSVE